MIPPSSVRQRTWPSVFGDKVFVEGLAKKNPKAKRGYSRDKRPDCKQVVVALVVNRDGFPLLHEVFEGNVQDRATLGRMLDLH